MQFMVDCECATHGVKNRRIDVEKIKQKLFTNHMDIDKRNC